MGRIGKLIIMLLVVALLLFLPTRANAQTESDISKQLICQCGCTLVLLSCNHAECGSREAMTTVIKEKINQGQTDEQIIAFFTAQYGEQVLAAPPKRGFNLMAWLLPFAALLVGAVVVYVALKKWVRRGNIPQTDAVTETDEADEEYRRQLEEELEKFTERSFR
jgi:cytochrome c-type biogenesis protein CcmH